MRRIEQRVSHAYIQALLCVEYRAPKLGSITRPAYLMALAERYGLMGSAAAHSLILDCIDDEDLFQVRLVSQSWAEMVEEHLMQFMRRKLPFELSENEAYMVARASEYPISIELKNFDPFEPQSSTIPQLADAFLRKFHRATFIHCPFWKRGKLAREMGVLSSNSARFALHFFDRRRADLDEYPHIALLGE